MTSDHARRWLLLALFVGLFDCTQGLAGNPVTNTAKNDSLYRAHHPRLLFERSDIPGLQNKLREGGRDTAAYQYIMSLVDTAYSVHPVSDIIERYSYGVGDLPNLGVAAHLTVPADTAAMDIGRRATLYLTENYDPDNSTFYCSLRLRSLSLGYDLFFEKSSENERILVRSEIEAYIETIMNVFDFELWLHQPYVSNISSMIGSALGLGAICLADQLPADRIDSVLVRADQFVATWMRCHLDPDGAYNEDAMYAGWSLRNLIPYFEARKRFDGYDYANFPGIRNMERWIAFAVLPNGGGKVNNINDAAYLNYPLSRHQTYFEWAQSIWQSGLSAWLWEHLVGDEYGHDSKRLADKAATVLWNQNISIQNPGEILPASYLWRHRGLYYFRTGWQRGMSSDDVVFSFFSGKFQGGHAHEDQNSFTLYGYGARFALDHGYGGRARQSEAHNMPFVDGKGQHFAGGSVGTDGSIPEYLLGTYADYLLGDATSAYTTHSEFNRPGYPFPFNDWSWGYDGGNPVNFALRRVIVIHDSHTPPYFVIIDDIEKDDSLRTYEWRMHTLDENTVDTLSNPIRISNGTGHLDLHVLNPAFDTLTKRLTPFDNHEIDPNSTIVSLTHESVSANFAVMMFPRDASTPSPQFSLVDSAWGKPVSFYWPDGYKDVLLINQSGDTIRHTINIDDPGISNRSAVPPSTSIDLETDADITHLRLSGDRIARYLLTNVSHFVFDDTPVVTIPDGKANISLSGSAIDIDRDDVDFVLLAFGVEEVFYRGHDLAVVRQDGYLRRDNTRDGSGPPRSATHLQVWSYPNPFNAVTNVYIELGERSAVEATIYDAAGRRVKQIWNDQLPRGGNVLVWDGTKEKGNQAASGVYFLKTQIPGNTQTHRLVLIK
ncbi:MAG: heparinase II/III family protein [Candidatus Latescibacterota bacterium]|nr:MAG: heparinase II/III family protein [Candidatus Latescibacterota bacterium]